jgi:TadE-like protein
MATEGCPTPRFQFLAPPEPAPEERRPWRLSGASSALSERGQATVELAMALPFVVFLLLALIQGGLVVRDQILVTHAAREAVRAAAVEDDTGAVNRAARSAGPLQDDRLHVRITGRGEPGSRVTVHVTYDAPTRVPLAGRLLGDVQLHANASMRVER